MLACTCLHVSKYDTINNGKVMNIEESNAFAILVDEAKKVHKDCTGCNCVYITDNEMCKRCKHQLSVTFVAVSNHLRWQSSK